ncbi:hypothetical protein C0J26_07705 [Pseudomonas baetica]|nr:hypothetical protein C0J26_07705 [Pseudomonas baetica]
MNRLTIDENEFIKMYISNRYNTTAVAIAESYDKHLSPSEQNYESAIELGSTFMYHFGRTNIQEFDAFIQKHQVEFSTSKIKAFFNRTFNRRVELDIDFEKIRTKVLDNYDLAAKQAEKFLAELTYKNERVFKDEHVNRFVKNNEEFKKIAEILINDYFYYTSKPIEPSHLAGKHLYTILQEMGEQYDNITANFRDCKNWRFENNLLVLPKKAVLVNGATHVDLINAYGGGYELSTLVKDKDYFSRITAKAVMYSPDLIEPLYWKKHADPEKQIEQQKRLDAKMAEDEAKRHGKKKPKH